MSDYYLHLYDTSGRRITRGSIRITAEDDFEAITKTAVHDPSEVYRAVLTNGRQIVAEWPKKAIY